jgi:hypothetical protein
VRAAALVVEKGGGAPAAAPSSGGEGEESRRPCHPAISAEPLGQQLSVRGGRRQRWAVAHVEGD